VEKIREILNRTQLCLKDRWDSGEIACERSAGNRFFSDMPTLPHCPDFPVGHVV